MSEKEQFALVIIQSTLFLHDSNRQYFSPLTQTPINLPMPAIYYLDQPAHSLLLQLAATCLLIVHLLADQLYLEVALEVRKQIPDGSVLAEDEGLRHIHSN